MSTVNPESRRYGMVVKRASGQRSSYDLWDGGTPAYRENGIEGTDEFVIIRHYLPQPMNGPVLDDNGRLIGFEDLPFNQWHPVEARWSGLAISLEDWQNFKKMIAGIYLGDRGAIRAREVWTTVEAPIHEWKDMPDGPVFTERDLTQIRHALYYAEHFAGAGSPGDSAFKLIAKMAKVIGLA